MEETVEVVATVEVAAKVAAVLVVAATAEEKAAAAEKAKAAARAAVVVGWVVEVPLVGGAEAGRAATAPHMRIGRCSMRGHDTRET